MKTIRNILTVAVVGLAVLGCAALAHTSTPNTFYTFTDGEVLTAAKLNANFQHLHNTLTGLIRNENIASDAAIAHSKFAQPGLIAKAVGGKLNDCTVNGICPTLLPGSTNVNRIERTGTGQYTVYYSTPLSITTYAVIANSLGGVSDVICKPYSYGAGGASISIQCYNINTNVDADAALTFVAYAP